MLKIWKKVLKPLSPNTYLLNMFINKVNIIVTTADIEIIIIPNDWFVFNNAMPNQIKGKKIEIIILINVNLKFDSLECDFSKDVFIILYLQALYIL